MWTREEIDSVLIDPLPGDKTTADLFSHHYGVESGGNVSPVQVFITIEHLFFIILPLLSNQLVIIMR